MEFSQVLKDTVILAEKQQYQKHFTNMLKSRLNIILKAFFMQHELHKNLVYKDSIKTLSFIKNTLQELRKAPAFKSYGGNSSLWNYYQNIGVSFNELVKGLRDAKFLISLDKAQNFDLLLFNQQMGFSKKVFEQIDQLVEAASQVIQDPQKRIEKNVLKKITSEIGFCFWFNNFASEVSVNWIEFASTAELFFLQLEGIKCGQGSRERLKQIIDPDSHSVITSDSVNLFFNFYWPSPFEKIEILDSNVISNDLSVREQFQEPKKLKLQITEIPPDHSVFQQNEIIEITTKYVKSGANAPQNLIEPGIIKFGRQSQNVPVKNDIYFHPGISTVSRRQFQIIYREISNTYDIVCTSSSNPTLFKVGDMPFELQRNMRFCLSESEIFHVRVLSGEHTVVKDLIKDMVHLNIEQPDYYNRTMMTKVMEEQQLLKRNVGNSENPYLLSELIKDQSNGQKSTKSIMQESDGDDVTCNFKQQLEKSKDPSMAKQQLQESKEAVQLQIEKPKIEIKCVEGELKNNKFVYEVDKIPFVIKMGRSQDNHIVFKDNQVSQNHCQIVYDESQKWKLCQKFIKEQTDFSTCGTFVYLKNQDQYTSEQPSNPVPLRKGMKIFIEGTLLQVEE